MNKGFFKLLGEPEKVQETKPSKRTTSKTPTKKKVTLNPCDGCGLYKDCLSPKMGVTGEGKKRILFLAEAQGGTEDEKGYQLCGEAGQLLRDNLPRGFDLDRDAFKVNAVRCRPFVVNPKTGKKSNRTPTDKEIALCREETWNLIKQLDINAIIILGRVPLQSYLLNDMAAKPTMLQWVNWTIPDRGLGVWIIPQYHPSFFLRQGNDKLIGLYQKSLSVALDAATKPFPELSKEEDKVEIILDEQKAIRLLTKLLDRQPHLLSFDWETTGLKPYRAGHKIISVGLSWNPEKGVAFPLFPGEVTFLVKRLLQNKKIGKIAHHMKFEEIWARQILGIEVNNWVWCSMLASHVLDDRKDITGLEFQAFVRYGIRGFKDETGPYMKADDSNSINKIDDCPIDKLLLRNGMDAMITYRLALDQMKEMEQEEGLMQAYRLFHEGSLAFVDTEERGLPVSIDYFRENSEKMGDEFKALESELINSHYGELYKRDTGKVLNPLSDTQLKKLLFSILKVKPIAYTDKGKSPKLDQEVIEELSKKLELASVRHFIQDIVRLRKLRKTNSTYLKGFLREIT